MRYLNCTPKFFLMQPTVILQDFFTTQRLSEIHSQINRIVKLALISEDYDDPEERQKLLTFQDGLTECIDAAYKIAGK